jgi:hypothetical protein
MELCLRSNTNTMRKIEHSIRLFIILFIPILVLVNGASPGLAQAGGSSVMIYNKAKPGTEDSSVGNALEQAFIKGLEDKYPCVDWMNEKTLADAIQRLREQELLTGELDEKALADLGKSVGATYIIIVRVITMPNGQTMVSARVIDGKGASMVADQMEQATGTDATYKAAQSVAQKLLQDLASKFGNECDAHWTGTITYSEKTLIEKEENKNNTVIEKVHSTSSEKYDHTVEVTLQSMAKGGKVYFYTSGFDSMTLSRVSRRHLEHIETNIIETGEEPCRERGKPTYRKQYKSTYKRIFDEQGENTQTLPVEIQVNVTTGRARIKVPTPELLLKKKESIDEVRDFCPPQTSSQDKPGERTDIASFFDFDAPVDPKNPNILTGRQVTGTLDMRQRTIIWNLRLVQPKKKR